MQSPPGPRGPQLSPDGRYWWDGVRWVPLGAPQAYWQQPQPYQVPPPSPGLRTFLIVVLVVSDVLTGLIALSGLLAIADYLGWAGPPSDQPTDPLTYVLIAFFELMFIVTLAATIGVLRRSPWARVVTIVAGGVVCLSVCGLVLGIPIIVAAIRAPMAKPAVPLGYA